jgi:iron complex outermembrane receptor protein
MLVGVALAAALSPRPVWAIQDTGRTGEQNQADSPRLLPDTLEARGQAGAGRSDTLDVRAEVELEDLLVTVTRSSQDWTRVPYALSLVRRQQIQRAERALSLDQALRGVPGVTVQNRQNFSLGDRLIIRGAGARAQFGVRGIMILADGIPLTLPDGQAVLSNLDLLATGRAEVIRGPASSLYGNAAGGVISLRTEDFAPEPLVVRPAVAFGNYGFAMGRLKLSGTAGSTGYLADFEANAWTGFREYGSADFYRFNVTTRSAVGERAELRLTGSYFSMPFAENPSSLNEEDARERPRFVRPFVIEQGAGKEIRQGQFGLAYASAPAGSGRLELTGWGLLRDVRNPIPGRIIVLDRAAGGLRASYEASTAVASWPFHWIVGTDISYLGDDREEYENLGVQEAGGEAQAGDLLIAQREEVGALGPFLQLTLQPAAAVSVTAGGRFDVYGFRATDRLLADGDDSGERTFTRFSPMVGVEVTANAWLHLYANVATAYQTPTTSELSNRPSGEGGFNPLLDPETTVSFSAGAKGVLLAPRLSYDLALYTADVRDAILPFQGPDEDVFFRNAGEVTRRGVELQTIWTALAGFEARLSYTYQDFVFGDFTTVEGDFSGNREPGVPIHQLDAGLTYSRSGWVAEGRFRWVDAYPVNDSNTASNWSYGVVDLRLSATARLGVWALVPYVGVDNLFSARYNGSVVPNAFADRYYEPTSNASLYVGLSVGLPSPSHASASASSVS